MSHEAGQHEGDDKEANGCCDDGRRLGPNVPTRKIRRHANPEKINCKAMSVVTAGDIMSAMRCRQGLAVDDVGSINWKDQMPSIEERDAGILGETRHNRRKPAQARHR
ncbi:hypothetical protein [Rhizobium chutanense]|uniref:hypothetical protein n=1 Tax=Rhizobium chutanense TaxID=2035448 RepID=UPI0015CF0A53|nr:hypothetical protein [Rhizobium chutanense]